MLRKNKFVIGEHYHVYNRGVDKKILFKDEADFKRFVILLYIANSTKSFSFKDLRKSRKYLDFFSIDKKENLVTITAWCLMGNHFHILLKEKTENGISKFMKKLGTGYSMYFNKKYKRTGTLFSSIFQSKHVSSDFYFNKVLNYIHLNPLEILDKKQWEKIEIQKSNDLDLSDAFIESNRNILQNYKNSSFLDSLFRREEGNILN